MYHLFYDDKDQIYVHVNRIGKDFPDLWLVHGFTESSECFNSIFSAQLAQCYNLYLPDLPGFGKTKYIPDHHNLSESHKVIARLIGKYSLQKDICLLGHSLGGAIAVQIAAEKSVSVKLLLSIDGLLCEDLGKTSNLSYVEDFMSSPDTFKRFIVKQLRVKEKNSPYIQRYLDNIKKTEARVLYEWAMAMLNILAKDRVYNQFVALTCEKYFIFGSESINSSNITAIKKSPSIPSIEISSVGHWPMLEEPNTFWAIIGRLLTKKLKPLPSSEDFKKIRAKF
jgi:pimeloyl-ACP methyl ester carboxylesterase